jgi:lysozyme family protein
MADFKLAIPIVLQNEGGYVNDPNDPGGETKYGISKHAYPDVDIKNLTEEQASDIYLRDFWKFDGIKIQEVANKVFDSYVNLKHTAIRLAQNCVGLPQDGLYGPRTEAAINSMSPTYFLTSYRQALVTYYRELTNDHPIFERYLTGWLRRANQ